jgi:hypothetical protein
MFLRVYTTVKMKCDTVWSGLEDSTSPSYPPHISDRVSILPQNIGMFVPDLLALHPSRR